MHAVHRQGFAERRVYPARSEFIGTGDQIVRRTQRVGFLAGGGRLPAPLEWHRDSVGVKRGLAFDAGSFHERHAAGCVGSGELEKGSFHP